MPVVSPSNDMVSPGAAPSSLRVIVAREDSGIARGTIVADVAEGDVLDTTTGCRAVFLVPPHLDLQDAALTDVLDADVVERHAFHVVAVHFRLQRYGQWLTYASLQPPVVKT